MNLIDRFLSNNNADIAVAWRILLIFEHMIDPRLHRIEANPPRQVVRAAASRAPLCGGTGVLPSARIPAAPARPVCVLARPRACGFPSAAPAVPVDKSGGGL